ncbi:polymorphic toxin type 50 domain-containing protein [Bifidobacterium boum]|uniref:polymorphic toxin type 50 domain-containing protein n=1 Tax=Bifidobacterium boum TaxID=78343 RepID=UPI003993637E
MLVRVQLPPLARTNRSFGSGFLFSGDFPGLNNKMWGYGSIPIPEKHAKTTCGTIHYSAKGAHIVPAYPEENRCGTTKKKRTP